MPVSSIPTMQPIPTSRNLLVLDDGVHLSVATYNIRYNNYNDYNSAPFHNEVEIVIPSNDFNVNYVQNWFHSAYNQQTGMIKPALSYKRDILIDNVMLRNCFIKQINFGYSSGYLHLDLGVDYTEYNVESEKERLRKLRESKLKRILW